MALDNWVDDFELSVSQTGTEVVLTAKIKVEYGLCLRRQHTLGRGIVLSDLPRHQNRRHQKS